MAHFVQVKNDDYARIGLNCAATIILAGMTTTVLAGGEESEAA